MNLQVKKLVSKIRPSKVRLNRATSNVLDPLEKRMMMTVSPVASWSFAGTHPADTTLISLSPTTTGSSSYVDTTGTNTATVTYYNGQNQGNPTLKAIGMNASGGTSVYAVDILSTTGTANTSFVENLWRVRGAGAGANGTSNGWWNQAPQYTQGVEMDLNLKGYSSLNTLSFDWYCTGSGPRDMQIQYTLDGSTWNKLGVPQVATSGDYQGGLSTGSTPTTTINLSTISGVADDTHFGLRMVSSYDPLYPKSKNYSSAATLPGGLQIPLSNTGGNWRFGNFNVTGTVGVPTPPSVSVQPASQTIYNAYPVAFTSTANGYPGATEQWQVSTDSGSTWTNATAATGTGFASSTLTIASVNNSQNGYQYRAVFNNGQGGDSSNNVYSNPATLTVNPLVPPTITVNPTSLTTNGTNTVNFSAAVDTRANPLPTVQWYFEPTGSTTYSPVGSPTSAYTTTLPVTASPATSGSYIADFTNVNGGSTVGTANSSAATLTVYSSPTILLQPINKTVQTPNSVTFSATALAESTPTVTWQYAPGGGTTFQNVSVGNVAVSAGVSTYNSINGLATFTFTPTSADQADRFRVVFTTSTSVTSNTAVLSVLGSTITSWTFPTAVSATFPGDTTAGSADNPTPTFGTGSLISLGMNHAYNPGIGSEGADDDITGTSGSLNPSFTANAWRVRGGSAIYGAGAPEGWSSFAPQMTQGAEFDVPTTGFTDVHVHFDVYGTVSGPRDAVVQYSTDGSTWQTYSFANGSSVQVSPGDDYFGSTNATTPPTGVVLDFTGNTAVSNNANFKVRFVDVYQQSTNPSSPDYLPALYDGNASITDGSGNIVSHGQYAVADTTLTGVAAQEIVIGGTGDSGTFTLTVPTSTGNKTTAPISYTGPSTYTYNNAGTIIYTLQTNIQNALNAVPGITGAVVTSNDGICSNFIIQFKNGQVTGPVVGASSLTGTYFPAEDNAFTGASGQPSAVKTIYAGNILPYSQAGSGNFRFANISFTANTASVIPAWLDPASSSVNGGPAVWNFFSQTLTVNSGTANIIGDPALSGDAPNLVVNGAGTVLTINNAAGTAVNVNSVSETNGATIRMTSTTRSDILVLPAGATYFNLDSISTFDLGRSYMDLKAATSAQATTLYSSINGLVTTGYSNGLWNGPGIDSSTANTNPSHLTAVGMIQNNGIYSAAPGSLGLFDGITPGQYDLLLHTTYYGDTNLDGKVDGSDYSNLDTAYLVGTGNWANGNSNFDAAIDGSDYTLMDNAFNTQGAQLSAVIAAKISAKPNGKNAHFANSNLDVGNDATAATASFAQIHSLVKQDQEDTLAGSLVDELHQLTK